MKLLTVVNLKLFLCYNICVKIFRSFSQDGWCPQTSWIKKRAQVVKKVNQDANVGSLPRVGLNDGSARRHCLQFVVVVAKVWLLGFGVSTISVLYSGSCNTFDWLIANSCFYRLISKLKTWCLNYFFTGTKARRI